MTQAFWLLLLPLASSLAWAKPEKIRGVRDPIYHLYLQSHPDDASIAVLGPEASAESFEISGSIQSTNSSLYMNIGDDSTSYKSVTLQEQADTDTWGLEGDTVIQIQTSPYGRQLNFLVCELDETYWQLYLQTGSEQPTGRTCSNYQTIHLPCLC